MDLNIEKSSLTRTKPLSVLVCEDDPQALRLIEKQLSKLGHNVVSVRSSAEMLTALYEKRDSIDVAVVDVVLPDMHGDQAVSWIRQSELEALAQLPVLFVTGNPHAIKESFFERHPNTDILAKPFSSEALSLSISAFL